MDKLSLDLQTGIYSALSENVGLQSLGVRVYDSVPEETVYPYLQIGDETSVPFDTDTNSGIDTTFMVHTWTQNRGRAQAKEIMAAVYAAIHRKEFDIGSGTMILIQFEFETITPEPEDGVTYHGVQRFRALLEGN